MLHKIFNKEWNLRFELMYNLFVDHNIMYLSIFGQIYLTMTTGRKSNLQKASRVTDIAKEPGKMFMQSDKPVEVPVQPKSNEHKSKASSATVPKSK